MKIGNRINQLRKLSGMTQEQLADKLNVSRQTISKWETNSSVPDLESVVNLSRLFHVSLDELLMEGEEQDSYENEEKIMLEDLVRINIHKMHL